MNPSIGQKIKVSEKNAHRAVKANNRKRIVRALVRKLIRNRS